jgi:hypothetical protein
MAAALEHGFESPYRKIQGKIRSYARWRLRLLTLRVVRFLTGYFLDE